jgi:hypothetical protein
MICTVILTLMSEIDQHPALLWLELRGESAAPHRLWREAGYAKGCRSSRSCTPTGGERRNTRTAACECAWAPLVRVDHPQAMRDFRHVPERRPSDCVPDQERRCKPLKASNQIEIHPSKVPTDCDIVPLESVNERPGYDGSGHHEPQKESSRAQYNDATQDRVSPHCGWFHAGIFARMFHACPASAHRHERTVGGMSGREGIRVTRATGGRRRDANLP